MTAHPDLSPDVRAKQLADEYTTLAETAERAKQRMDEIKAILADLLPTGGPAGDYKVTVTRPKRLNAKALEQAFPVAQHPHLYAPAISTAAVRAHIAEVDLAQYQVEGRPVVKIQ